MTKDIKIFPNLKSLSEAVADEWCDGANRALKEKVTFCVALSGGNTAPAVYRNLVDLQLGKRISWSVVHIFWGDERCVPP
ncbi:MAG TPA: 6-phosphogluconolactonase, partial [Nitrospinaceae bacterium]|nr:6-phosphogluconolactonase [Nitrospinaceae bacterium]